MLTCKPSTAPDNFGVDPRIRVTRWPFSVIWVSLGSILVIKLSKDAHRGALQGPRIDFSWFLMDFGSPSGDHFGSLFHIICDLKCTKACLDCMHEFWWILSENLVIFDGPTSQKYCKYWCFHEISLFRLFRYFDDFRYLLGPHFGHFWRSWDTILMIFGCIGHALKFHWFSGPPQVEITDLVGGKVTVQGVQ